MPELPEVETIRLGLKSQICDRTIISVKTYQKKLRWTVPDLEILSVGKTISRIKRRGKYLIFYMKQGGSMITHFGMSGRFKVLHQYEPPQKHDHIDLQLDSNIYLRFHDPRKFGAILWTDQNPLHHRLLIQLGPEPLHQRFNKDYLYHQCSGRHQAMKPLIMNSQIVVGVGNIYANEALFYAKIDPHLPAHQLSRCDCDNLVQQIKKILKRAIRKGGTSLKDFRNSNGQLGYFQQKLLVYKRENQPCPNCRTPISKTYLGQRASYYCRQCQSTSQSLSDLTVATPSPLGSLATKK